MVSFSASITGYKSPSTCPCGLSDIVPGVTPGHATPVLELPAQSGRALLATSPASCWHGGYCIIEAGADLPPRARSTYPQVCATLGAAGEKK